MTTSIKIPSNQNNPVSSESQLQEGLGDSLEKSTLPIDGSSKSDRSSKFTLPILWTEDFVSAQVLAECFRSIGMPGSEGEGNHIIAIQDELTVRRLAQKIKAAGGTVQIFPCETRLEVSIATMGLDAAPMIVTGVISYDQWLASLKNKPLQLEEAVAIAEDMLKSDPDSLERNIALDSLRQRAKVSEYNWDKKYLDPIRARLERTLGLPAQPPNILELTEPEVKKLIAGIIDKGVAGAELRAALNQISHNTPWRIDQLYKLHQQQLEDIERVESRDNTLEQLESLLSASNASLDLHQFLHPHLAKPLLHLASRLSLKPEVYLTTLLTTVSSLHHPNTRIWLSKEDDFDQPAGLYSGIVADSSQKKSPILKAIATKPLKVLQAEEKRAYEQKLKAYQYELEKWETLPKEKKREVDPPVKPERAVFFLTKTTGEGLEYQAARQPEQGILYLSDELVSMINNQNKYTNGKGSDKQDLLSYYDGTANTTLRADGIKSELDTILLAIIGAIQPEVLQKLLNNCEDSDGNWARFLFVNQPNVAARLHTDGGQVDLTGLLVDLYRKIRALPATEYTLSPEAFKVFQQAYNRYEQNRVNDPLAGMRSVWGKSEGRAGRLAINLHVINSLAAGRIPSGVIDVETMRQSITLADYYASQVKALYTEFSDSDALAPHLAKVIEMSLKAIQSQSKGWLKANEVCRAITKAKRPTTETVRLWFTELFTLGKGEVMGSGRSLSFRVFTPESPPPEKGDKRRQKIDKSSIAEVTAYQALQEKGDKGDKRDDFQKNLNEAKKHEEVGLITELVKKSLLGESSLLSPNPQNNQPAIDVAIDRLSTESSPFTESSLLEAIIPTSPTEIDSQPVEIEVQEQAPQQSVLPTYQLLNGNYELQSITLDSNNENQPVALDRVDKPAPPSVVVQGTPQANVDANESEEAITPSPVEVEIPLPIYQRSDGTIHVDSTQLDDSFTHQVVTQENESSQVDLTTPAITSLEQLIACLADVTTKEQLEAVTAGQSPEVIQDAIDLQNTPIQRQHLRKLMNLR